MNSKTTMSSLLESVVSAVKAMSKEEVIHRLQNTKNTVFREAMPCEKEIELFFGFLNSTEESFEIASDYLIDFHHLDRLDELYKDLITTPRHSHYFYDSEGSSEPSVLCTQHFTSQLQIAA